MALLPASTAAHPSPPLACARNMAVWTSPIALVTTSSSPVVSQPGAAMPPRPSGWPIPPPYSTHRKASAQARRNG